MDRVGAATVSEEGIAAMAALRNSPRRSGPRSRSRGRPRSSRTACCSLGWTVATTRQRPWRWQRSALRWRGERRREEEKTGLVLSSRCGMAFLSSRSPVAARGSERVRRGRRTRLGLCFVWRQSEEEDDGDARGVGLGLAHHCT